MKIFLLLISIILLVPGCSKENRNEIVVPVKYGGKFGFIDRSGHWFIKPQFDSVSNFWNGYASVFKDDKEGIINTWGKLVIKCEYDFIGLFENDLALVRIGDSINYIGTTGKLISETNFYDGEDFSEGLAAVQFEEDGKWGYLNTRGEIQIVPAYDYVQAFKEAVASVELGDLELQIDVFGKVLDTVELVSGKRKFPIIGYANTRTLGRLNSRGDTIMDMKYRSFGYPQGDLMWFFTGEKYGLADTSGTIRVEPTYEKLWYFADNDLALAKANNKYGYIDRKGTVKIPFKYQDTKGFKYRLAAVKVGGKWGFINDFGKLIIDPEFENVIHHFKSTLSKKEAQYVYDHKWRHIADLIIS